MAQFWILLLGPVLLLCTNHAAANNNTSSPQASPQQHQIQQESAADQMASIVDALLAMGPRLQTSAHRISSTEDGNFLLSPLSAALVIAQLMLGATGPLQHHLHALLVHKTRSDPDESKLSSARVEEMSIKGMNKADDKHRISHQLHNQLADLLMELMMTNDNYEQQYLLKQKSGLFMERHIQLRHQFLHDLHVFYTTEVWAMDFQNQPRLAQKFINEWGANQTNGLIQNILQQPPTATTTAILTNALYFKAEWQQPFSDLLNRDGPFQVTPKYQVNVTYMHSYLEQIPYVESPELRLICLPYMEQGDVGMYIVQVRNEHSPLAYNTSALAGILQPERINELIAKTHQRDVIVKIPKMELSTRFSLKRYLLMAADGADDGRDLHEQPLYLNNATQENQTLRIDDVVQELVLAVNEKGTEAAAITAATIDYIGGSKTVLLTRPFIFFIRHEASGATLFWGAISNPRSS